MAWWWYLATPDYRAAPQFKPEGRKEEGTEAPIDPTFKSRYLGKGLEDVAQWLLKKPLTVDVEGRYFGVVDKQTARTGKVGFYHDLLLPLRKFSHCKLQKHVLWLDGCTGVEKLTREATTDCYLQTQRPEKGRRGSVVHPQAGGRKYTIPWWFRFGPGLE